MCSYGENQDDWKSTSKEHRDEVEVATPRQLQIRW